MVIIRSCRWVCFMVYTSDRIFWNECLHNGYRYSVTGIKIFGDRLSNDKTFEIFILLRKTGIFTFVFRILINLM